MKCNNEGCLDKEIKEVFFEFSIRLDSDNGEIERFYVNGEIASFPWFRQGNKEYNGRYVTSITYEEAEDEIERSRKR